jgi:hypothetical protein
MEMFRALITIRMSRVLVFRQFIREFREYRETRLDRSENEEELRLITQKWCKTFILLIYYNKVKYYKLYYLMK